MVERNENPKAVDMRIFDDEESHNDEDEEDNEDEEDASSKAPGDVEERESKGGRHGEIAKHTEGDVHLLAEVVVIM